MQRSTKHERFTEHELYVGLFFDGKPRQFSARPMPTIEHGLLYAWPMPTGNHGLLYASPMPTNERQLSNELMPSGEQELFGRRVHSVDVPISEQPTTKLAVFYNAPSEFAKQ